MVVLQWGAPIAMNYVGREIGLKKIQGRNTLGLGWTAIQKVTSECIGIHTEVETLGEEFDDLSREEKYEKQFNMTREEKKAALERENGYLPNREECKASLERYRYCSGKIFGEIREFLDQNVGNDNYVFEKASIDEMFLDITEYCWAQSERTDSSSNMSTNTTESIAANATKCLVIKPTTTENDDDDDDDDNNNIIEENDDYNEHSYSDNLPNNLPLTIAATLASNIRLAVFNNLHYTISVGISTNKTIAKLIASYNKVRTPRFF